MRLRALLLEQCPQPRGGVVPVPRDLLATQVGLLERDEVECQLVAVLAQEPAREPFVDALELEVVRTNELRHVRPQACGIAKPPERSVSQPRAPFRVVSDVR